MIRTGICAFLLLLAAFVNAQTTVAGGSLFSYTSPVGYVKGNPGQSFQIGLTGKPEKGVVSHIGILWAPSEGYDLDTMADEARRAMSAKPGVKFNGTEKAKVGGKEARFLFFSYTAEGKSIKQLMAVTISGSNYVGLILTTESSVFAQRLAAFKPTLSKVKWLK